MLNGLDPVIIFQFAKISPSLSDTLAKIPLVADIPTVVEAPPIPIYLSERLTEIIISSETKTMDTKTDDETKSDGSSPDTVQKGAGATVKINLEGKKNSTVLQLLLTLLDLAYNKVTSKEYSISYFHDAIIIFRGRISSLTVDQISNTDLLQISIELTRGESTPQKKADIPVAEKITGVTPL